MTAVPLRPDPGVARSPIQPSDWLPEHVAAIAMDSAPTIDLIQAGDFRRLVPDLDLWDVWPVQQIDGTLARFDGATLWMGLTAPVMGDPNLRHQHARIRLVLNRDGGWIDCGPAMPDGFSPGRCEWSGCAVHHPATGHVELHFTATGRRDEDFTHEQRLFATQGRLVWTGQGAGLRPTLLDWSSPVETLAPDHRFYRRADGVDLAPGFIPGNRDPALFRDPADGRDYLVFAASLTGEALYNAAIGLAAADGQGGWRHLGPVIRAPGLNHEMERPHIQFRDGRYYLFWCTQGKMFHPEGPVGPTGLYGMVADQVTGPYSPLNGTGLVAANPPEAPSQTYAWWVSAEGWAAGFVDQWGVAGHSDAELRQDPRTFFGGAAAPLFRVILCDSVSQLEQGKFAIFS